MGDEKTRPSLLIPHPLKTVPGAIRTPDLLIRSQMLYPAELRAHAVSNPENYNEAGHSLQPTFLCFCLNSRHHWLGASC